MNSILEANLLALSAADKKLHARLAAAEKTNRYAFLKSRSGETVPANALPLHSTVDPKREAERLVAAIPQDTDFLVFLGLGGGFAPKAALELTGARIVVIDFDIGGIAELFSAIDYSKLLINERFSLLIDPSDEEIKKIIIERYSPALCGGIKTIPLRTRTEQDISKFENSAKVIQEAIEIVSSDYSVQAHFGTRWFSNIIRNIKTAGKSHENFFAVKKSLPSREAAVVAAGPSLDKQLSSIAELKSRKTFIISSDTALPALLHNGIEPDAVVSIDCQHISYYHFLGCDLRNIPLVLDIASPPLLCGLSPSPVFFSSGHPLALYISAYWRHFSRLDTSGGNVTHACLSLAEIIGAEHITLFGADFSYIRCQSYARGTYIYPFFSKKQNRLSPIEAQFSAFLYRSPFLPPEDGEKSAQRKNHHETSSLRFYRKKLEEKVSTMTAAVSCAQGLGAPVSLRKAPHAAPLPQVPFITETAAVSGVNFLEQYRSDIAALPEADADDYIKKLNEKERRIFTTLLPYAAAVRKRSARLKQKDLIEEVKRRSAGEIERILTAEN